MKKAPSIPSVSSDEDAPPLPSRAKKITKAKAMKVSERLYKHSATKQRKLQQAEKQKPKGCTFKPKLRAGKKIARPKSGPSIGERLFKEQNRLQKKRNALKKRLHTESFKPKMYTKTKSSESRQERINRLFNDGKARDKKRSAAIEAKKKAESSYGFKPKLNKRSLKMSKGRQSVAETGSLLEKAKRLKAMKAERELKGCTFKPKLTRSRSAPKTRVRGTFLERAAAFEAKRGQNISKLLQQQYNRDKKVLTFSPNRTLKRTSKGKKRSSPEDIGKRLYKVGIEREKQLQEQMKKRREQAYRKFNFRPKIGRSKSAGRARPNSKKRSSIYDRLYGESKLIEENKKRAALEHRQRETEGLFQPKIKTKNTSGSTGSASIFQRLAVDDVKHRQEALVRQQEEKEQRLLEGCSFEPSVDVEREQEEEYETVFDRLYETDIGITDAEPTGLDECTFEPVISTESQNLASHQEKGDVYDRLADLEVTRSKQKEFERQKINNELEACTFVPAVQSSVKGADGTRMATGDIFARLATPKGKMPPQSTKKSSQRFSGSKKSKISFLERVRAKAMKSLDSRSLKQSSSPNSSKLRQPVVKTAAHVKKIPKPVEKQEDEESEEEEEDEEEEQEEEEEEEEEEEDEEEEEEENDDGPLEF